MVETDQGMTRRTAIAGAAGLALAAIATDARAQPQPATAAGTVFEDTDGSFKRSATSQGIGGIMVSNGRAVVKTGADGRWSLPVQPGDTLFVIKPTGFMTELDPVTNLSRAHHIYAPDGTPTSLDLRFPGLAPTGALPDSIDFGLHRRDEPTTFTAVLLTDSQPETLAELGYVRDDSMARIATIPAAFAIHHGDVMFDDLSAYDRYNRIAGTAGQPMYVLCGNHDMNLEAPDNTLSRETFKRVYGARYGAFQYGGVTFFHLDNVEYLGTDPTKPNGFGKYQGHVGPQQIAFIRAVLANVPADSLVVYSLHIPLRTQWGTDPSVANIDNHDFLAAISSHPHNVSFAGHTHTNEHWYLGADQGYTAGEHHHHVLTAVSGSWWSGPFDDRGIPVALGSDGSPNGFHILAIDGTNYQTTLVPAHDPARSQIRIMLDSQLHGTDPEVMTEYPAGALLTGPISRAAAGSTRLLVNLFEGGPRSKVTMAIGGGQPAPMAKVMRTDPFVVEVYARNVATKKPWVKPDICTHLWQATLPADLPTGAHRIRITGTDEYGRDHTAAMVLEVT